jgi:STE24 endopeptidase
VIIGEKGKKQTMDKDREQIAKRYETIKLSLSIGESILTFILLVLFVLLGYSLQLREIVLRFSENSYIRFFLYFFILGAGLSVISFPIDYISGFWLEHRYGLSNQSFGGWLWEKTKGLLVGLIVMIPIMFVFYYLLRNYPQTWWLLLSLFMLFFTVILGKVAPLVIFPLFYKFIPIEDEAVLERMNALAEEGGFSLAGVYRFDLSKTTNKANAAFTGMGKTKRIIMGDTLLDNFSVDEIEAVFAHEVGHYVHKHIYIGILVSALSSFISFYLADYFYVKALNYFSFNNAADLAALPLLFLILTLLTLFITPFGNALSRRHERQADYYALTHIADPESFKSAMIKLSELNLSNRNPNPFVEFLFYSHPSIGKRTAFADNFIQRKKQR